MSMHHRQTAKKDGLIRLHFHFASLQEMMNFSLHRATVEKVRNMDRARKAYYNYYTGRHWGHSENYDMCLNTACYGIEGTVEVIEKMFNMFN